MPYPAITDRNIDKILAFLASFEDFVFLETGKPDQKNRYSFIFTKPLDRIILKANEDTEPFFSKAEKYQKDGFYLAGWLAYELGYKLEPSLNRLLAEEKNEILADLGIFHPPIIYDHISGKLSAPLPCSQATENYSNTDSPYSISNLRPNQDRCDYLTAISRIKSYIAAGDTYQVNYTIKLLFDISGSYDSLYKTLRRNQSVAYGAYIKSSSKVIMSFSPELFFRKKGSTCTVQPMKGTMARGRTHAEDLDHTKILHNDPKNRSENVMIVDLLRNDLGRLAKMGSINALSLFDVETFQTLHQMTSTIQGELRPNLKLQELFKALFPCGSVTGAPKIRTMEIINELEIEPRGVYTGTVGYISPQGEMVFNVPIRTIQLENGKGEMGIGSGIIHDSVPASEWQESLLKGHFLTQPMPEYQLIETILWSPSEQFWLLDLHMDRLCRSATYLQFRLDKKAIKGQLTKLSDEWSSSFEEKTNPSLLERFKQTRRVRILLHKAGRFTITHTTCDTPVNTGLPVLSATTKTVPKIILSKIRTDSTSAHLFHKTTIRKTYDHERKLAVDAGYLEIIFMNEENEITEGSISNIVIKKEEKFFTPSISCGLLPGTLRAQLLSNYPDLISEKTIYLKDLQKADNIYIANSVKGLVEVSIETGDH